MKNQEKKVYDCSFLGTYIHTVKFFHLVRVKYTTS